MTLDALIEAARDPEDVPEGMELGLDAEAMNLSELVTFPSGAHCAEVEIDPETGAVTLVRYQAVDDYGALVNPMLTRGQVQGGLAQGIGQALQERIAYDPEIGPAAQRLLHGLRAAAGGRPAGPRGRLRRGADPFQPARREGRRPGRRDRRAADGDACACWMRCGRSA